MNGGHRGEGSGPGGGREPSGSVNGGHRGEGRWRWRVRREVAKRRCDALRGGCDRRFAAMGRRTSRRGVRGGRDLDVLRRRRPRRARRRPWPARPYVARLRGNAASSPPDRRVSAGTSRLRGNAASPRERRVSAGTPRLRGNAASPPERRVSAGTPRLRRNAGGTSVLPSMPPFPAPVAPATPCAERPAPPRPAPPRAAPRRAGRPGRAALTPAGTPGTSTSCARRPRHAKAPPRTADTPRRAAAPG
jgi:hypothetical protein